MTTLPIMPAFEKNNVAVTLQSSEFYAPYASVTIQSIIDTSTANNNYDVIVVTLDMSDETAETICSLAKSHSNISIRVVNMLDLYNKYNINRIAGNDKRFGGITICRTFYYELFEKYDKIISMESDMLLCYDIAELYNSDLGNNYIGAVQDLSAIFIYHGNYYGGYLKKAIDSFLELSEPEQYINAGLIVFNLVAIRNKFTVKQFLEFIEKNNCQLFEQDTFNHFFRNNILYLEQKWNYLVEPKGVIETGSKKWTCHLLPEYCDAKKSPKLVHYITSIKPWVNPAIPFGTKWWNVAFRSPFYKQIEKRRLNIEEKDKPSRLLFVCETVMQLINILNIKYNLYPDGKADIIFTESTDFSRYIEPVEKLGMFEHIYRTKYNTGNEIARLRKTAPNADIMKNPLGYEYAVPLTQKYSDLFIATTVPISKTVYYQIVKSGLTPRIHFYEEGYSTYIDNIHSNVAADMFDHTIYEEKKRFENNIFEILLYEPQLYSAGEKYALSVIPKISKDNKPFIDILYSVFGKVELPEEKYIFISECFAADGCASDDIEILDRIAERVGTDNITVKAHPRGKTEEKFYQMHGYRIFAEKIVPWEMFVLSADIENKILITVSSSTPVNQNAIFGKDVPTLFLRNIMILSERGIAKSATYKKYFEKAISFMNIKQKIAFCPNSIDELDTVIEYLEGEF